MRRGRRTQQGAMTKKARPTAAKDAALLPAKIKITSIDGAEFLRGVITAMGQRLLKRLAAECGEPAFKERALEIEAAFVKGLRRVATVLGPGGLRVKSTRDGDRLSPSGRRKKGTA